MFRRTISASVRPGTYSMAMNGSPSCSPTSKIVTMFRWFRRPVARASRRKRCRNSTLWTRATLIATVLSMAGSRARYSTPIPPLLNRSTTR